MQLVLIHAPPDMQLHGTDFTTGHASVFQYIVGNWHNGQLDTQSIIISAGFRDFYVANVAHFEPVGKDVWGNIAVVFDLVHSCNQTDIYEFIIAVCCIL
jgi:hypothetical protein